MAGDRSWWSLRHEEMWSHRKKRVFCFSFIWRPTSHFATTFIVVHRTVFSGRLDFQYRSKGRKMTDRRPINKDVTVPKPGGGEQPRSRNDDGTIRKKRDDAGKHKGK